MHPEVDAIVTLETGADVPASPITSYGFIVRFGSEAYSAAVLPTGSAGLKLNTPTRVRLRFLVEESQDFLRVGASFSFFEQGRTGAGTIV
jgi:hypothetical protein